MPPDKLPHEEIIMTQLFIKEKMTDKFDNDI